MSTVNTLAQMNFRQQQQSMRLLKDLIPNLKYAKFGERDKLDQRTGKKVVWRRYFELADVAPGGVDGAVPVGQPLTFEDIYGTIVSFPSKVPITRDDILFGEDDLIEVSKEKISNQLARTLDTYCFTKLKAGSQVRYAGGAASRVALVAAPTQADFDLAIRDLERQNVPKIAQMVGASMKVATEPVHPAYVAFMHPSLRGDIVRTAGFIPVEKYGTMQTLDPDEIGATPNGIRFIQSTINAPWLAAATDTSGQTTFMTNGSTGAGSADVFPILIMGAGAYGHVDLKNYRSMEVRIIRPGSEKAETVQDPMGENGCVASDLKAGCEILDQRRIVRLEALASNTWT